MAFEKLFTPIRINNMEIKNRWAMAAMGTGLCAGMEGYVSERLKDYYAARAKGGLGLIIVEVAIVDWELGRGTDAVMSIDDDRFIPGHAELAQAIQAHGCKAIIQLLHAGNEARIPVEKLAPSAVPHRTGTPREITKDEISRVVSQFTDAAERAKRAGYDGVEIHGAHRYLIAEFLSPETNKRKDEYGGDIAGRARFLREIFEAIREKVGPDYPVWTRMNGREEGVEGGLTLEDGQWIARMVQEAGSDAIDVSGWGLDSPGIGPKPGDLLDLAKAIKQEVSIPVMAVGGRMTPEVAEQALIDGAMDIAMIGRGLLADPEYVNKAAEGRLEDIRPCISCWKCIPLEYFVGTGQWKQKESIFCAVNPDMGHEREHEIKPVDDPLRVVVIGGGPAGMEAARVASLSGHHVTLFEASSELSKIIPDTAEPAGKYIGKINRYLARQMVKLGVGIRLGGEVSADQILTVEPHRVILAAKSTLVDELLPSLEGSVPEIHRINIDGGNKVAQVPVLERIMPSTEGSMPEINDISTDEEEDGSELELPIHEGARFGRL